MVDQDFPKTSESLTLLKKVEIGKSDCIIELERIIKSDPEAAAKALVFMRTECDMAPVTHLGAALICKYASGQKWLKRFYDEIVVSPDDMASILGCYFKYSESRSIPNSMKRGFRLAFDRFDSLIIDMYRYYNTGDVKIGDVIRLVHPKIVRLC